MTRGVVHDMLAGVEPRATRIAWPRVEAWLATPVPSAYRDLCDRFGSLFVGEWLWIHAPVSLPDHPSFDREIAGIRAGARDACDASGLPPPVFHPKRGGLLPFGSGRGGEGLFWDTGAADPDSWPVVALLHRAGAYGQAEWVHTHRPILGFLEMVVTTGLPGDGRERVLGPLPATAARAYGGAPASYWTPPDRAARTDPRRKALRSGTGVKALQALVPPPGPGRSVDDLAAALGTDLPTDYTVLMALYGPGVWADWLHVLDPASPGEGGVLSLIAQSHGLRDDFLPFAESIDGDVLGWVRRGRPDQWPLAWVPRHEDAGPAMPITFTAALLAWLRGTPVDSVFAPRDPDVDLVDQATFVPSEGP